MVETRIPRHACSPRDTARAGDLWRLVQEVAVHDSESCGWPPSRYRTLGTGFVVREMVGIHHREARYGEALPAETWIAETRREMLMRRETRISDVLSCSVEWVHIGREGGPERAPAELANAFPIRPSASTTLPPFTSIAPVELPSFELTPWWTEMDPMGHTNHPRYVDWADEAISRWLVAEGRDALALVPVAERVRFRGSALAGEAIVVATRRVGEMGEAAVFEMRMTGPRGLVCGVTLARRLP